MTVAKQGLGGQWTASVEAAQQYVDFLMDSTEQLFRAQTDICRDMVDLGGQEYLRWLSADSADNLESLPGLMERQLDFAAGISRRCLDANRQLQTSFQSLMDDHFPALNRSFQKTLDQAFTASW